MVAYNFQPGFAKPITSGEKHLTMREPRAGRSRHARVGEALQLTTYGRTKKRRQLGENTCILTAHVVLGPQGLVRVTDIKADGSTRAGGISLLLTAAEQGSPDAARWGDAFAKLDGFKDYATLYAWHAANGTKFKPDADGRVVRDLIAWVTA